jgi:hypothetical protein
MLVGAGKEPTTGYGRADDTDSAPLERSARKAAAHNFAAESDSWSKVTGSPLLVVGLFDSAVAGVNIFVLHTIEASSK